MGPQKKSDELTARECRALCGICPAGCGVVVTYDNRGRIANVRPDESAELGVICKLGCTIPPNVDTYWVGDAGPGPSYIEAGGDKHLYTNKTVRYMVNNLVYFANLLKEHPIPTNLRKLYEEAQKESR